MPTGWQVLEAPSECQVLEHAIRPEDAVKAADTKRYRQGRQVLARRVRPRRGPVYAGNPAMPRNPSEAVPIRASHYGISQRGRPSEVARSLVQRLAQSPRQLTSAIRAQLRAVRDRASIGGVGRQPDSPRCTCRSSPRDSTRRPAEPCAAPRPTRSAAGRSDGLHGPREETRRELGRGEGMRRQCRSARHGAGRAGIRVALARGIPNTGSTPEPRGPAHSLRHSQACAERVWAG